MSRTILVKPHNWWIKSITYACNKTNTPMLTSPCCQYFKAKKNKTNSMATPKKAWPASINQSNHQINLVIWACLLVILLNPSASFLKALNKETVFWLISVSARYPVVLESISATLMSYFNFQFEKVILKSKKMTAQIKIINAIQWLINTTTVKMATNLTARDNKFQSRLSDNRSNDRAKRFTFCTSEPIKWLVKKE